MVVELPVAIRQEEVRRLLGYPARRGAMASIESRLRGALTDARRLVRARGLFQRLAAEDAPSVGLEPIAAESLVIGLVTIGEELETRVGELLAAGAITEALLLDAAGSAAAEEAADRLGAVVCGDDPEAAGHVSCRISPGYGRWPIASQRLLFDVLPHGEAGVELLPSMLMVPRKSISFAMWLGADARPLAGLSGCVTCELERCRYRRSGAPAPSPGAPAPSPAGPTAPSPPPRRSQRRPR